MESSLFSCLMSKLKLGSFLGLIFCSKILNKYLSILWLHQNDHTVSFGYAKYQSLCQLKVGVQTVLINTGNKNMCRLLTEILAFGRISGGKLT